MGEIVGLSGGECGAAMKSRVQAGIIRKYIKG